MIEIEKGRPTFDITQPTWCRALFLPMAANNKMVWTDQGIQWVVDSVIELADINATTASRLLNTFQHVRSLKPGLQEKVKQALGAIVQQVSERPVRPSTARPGRTWAVWSLEQDGEKGARRRGDGRHGDEKLNATYAQVPIPHLPLSRLRVPFSPFPRFTLSPPLPPLPVIHFSVS